MNNVLKRISTKAVLSLASLLISISALGGEKFRLTAPLDTVGASGYYNIQLPPQAEALSKVYGLGDIRIKDSKGVDVPYFVHSENPVRSVSNFVDYTIKENTVKDSINILIVDNAKRDMIDRFSIVIGNADVNKYASVRGSNDLSQWYIVKQEAVVSTTTFDNSSEILYIDIPSGDYRYYEIKISNTQSSPLKVKQVGRINNSNIYGRFTEIDPKTMLQKDSTDKTTYLTFLDMPFNYHIGKVTFKTRTKGDYMRDAYFRNNGTGNSFTLSSRNENTFFLNDFEVSKNLKIEINNEDNQPLQIDSVRFYVVNRYLCAYLGAGQNYTIYAGNSDLDKPSYDIEHFRKDIPDNLPTVTTNSISITDEDLVAPPKVGERKLSFYETPLFLWSVIIIVGLFLIFICVKMISEIKKKQ